jgi:phosphate acetyltransferase
VTDEMTYETATHVDRIDPGVPTDDAERAEAVMRSVAEHLDEAWLAELPRGGHAPRLSPAAFRYRLVRRPGRPIGGSSCRRARSRGRVGGRAVAVRNAASPAARFLADPDEVAGVAGGLGLSAAGRPGRRRPDDHRRAVRRRARRAAQHKGMTEPWRASSSAIRSWSGR